MKNFKVVWLGGKVEHIQGLDIADAFRRAGYGGGAVRAVDYYEELQQGVSTSDNPCDR